MDEAAARLTLDWETPVRLDAIRKTIWTPAVLRANRTAKESAGAGTGAGDGSAWGYAVRAPQTYASLSAAAGIEVAGVVSPDEARRRHDDDERLRHLYRESAADDMAALGVMAIVAAPTSFGANVIALRV